MLEKEMMDNVSESLMIRTLRKWLDKVRYVPFVRLGFPVLKFCIL